MAPSNTKGRGEAITRITRWNVRGLNNPIKRNKVFSHVLKLKTEIAFIQETHLLNRDQSRLCWGQFTQVFHSDFSCKSRGVAILIHRKVQFIKSHVISDRNGRYIVVQGKLYGIPVILVNIYGPNWDNMQFYTALFPLFPDLNSHKLILGGDFNCVLNAELDRSKPTTGKLSKSAGFINSFLQTYKILDVWRFKNPTSREYFLYYIFFSSPPFIFKNRLFSSRSAVDHPIKVD